MERKVVIGNNGVDLHIADESFDPICTADCKKSASDIKAAWNATYGAGIRPEAVKEMYKALEQFSQAHDHYVDMQMKGAARPVMANCNLILLKAANAAKAAIESATIKP